MQIACYTYTCKLDVKINDIACENDQKYVCNLHAMCIQNIFISHAEFRNLTCKNRKILYAQCMSTAYKISMISHVEFRNLTCKNSKILHAHRMQIAYKLLLFPMRNFVISHVKIVKFYMHIACALHIKYQ